MEVNINNGWVSKEILKYKKRTEAISRILKHHLMVIKINENVGIVGLTKIETKK